MNNFRGILGTLNMAVQDDQSGNGDAVLEQVEVEAWYCAGWFARRVGEAAIGKSQFEVTADTTIRDLYAEAIKQEAESRIQSESNPHAVVECCQHSPWVSARDSADAEQRAAAWGKRWANK